MIIRMQGIQQVVFSCSAVACNMLFPAFLVFHHFPLTKDAGTGKEKSVFHWLA